MLSPRASNKDALALSRRFLLLDINGLRNQLYSLPEKQKKVYALQIDSIEEKRVALPGDADEGKIKALVGECQRLKDELTRLCPPDDEDSGEAVEDTWGTGSLIFNDDQ